MPRCGTSRMIKVHVGIPMLKGIFRVICFVIPIRGILNNNANARWYTEIK